MKNCHHTSTVSGILAKCQEYNSSREIAVRRSFEPSSARFIVMEAHRKYWSNCEREAKDTMVAHRMRPGLKRRLDMSNWIDTKGISGSRIRQGETRKKKLV